MEIPSGFELHRRSSPVTRPWEPIYAKIAGGRIIIGLEIRPEHTNSRGLLHGGLIAALSDNAMGLSVGQKLVVDGRLSGRSAITMSLSIDFINKAEIGEWLEVDTQFIHAGNRQAVTQAFVTANGRIIARANGTFGIT